MQETQVEPNVFFTFFFLSLIPFPDLVRAGRAGSRPPVSVCVIAIQVADGILGDRTEKECWGLPRSRRSARGRKGVDSF